MTSIIGKCGWAGVSMYVCAWKLLCDVKSLLYIKFLRFSLELHFQRNEWFNVWWNFHFEINGKRRFSFSIYVNMIWRDTIMQFCDRYQSIANEASRVNPFEFVIPVEVFFLDLSARWSPCRDLETQILGSFVPFPSSLKPPEPSRRL